MRNAASRQSAQFLTGEADKIAADIQTLGEQIAKFKGKHPEGTPEFSQSNFQMQDRTELELRDARSRLGGVEQQRIMIDAQLVQMSPTSQMYSETGQRIMSPADRLKTRKAELASLKARYGATHPDVIKAEREIEGLQAQVSADGSANDLMRRLDDARAQLADVKARYSASHPDVLRLSRVIGDIEKQLDTLPATERVRQARTNPDNPAYIQLKAQLDSLNTEKVTLEKRITELDRRMMDFQGKLAQAPEVEREYRRLLRDYDNAQTKYQEVRLKQREAESSQNLETERKGERFTLIEPPLPPERPISPNRPVLLLLGLVTSAMLALAVAVGLDSLNPAVKGVADLTRLTEVAPLALIPHLATAAEAGVAAPRARSYWLIGVVAFGVLLLLVHLLVTPLDTIAMNVLKRFGG